MPETTVAKDTNSIFRVLWIMVVGVITGYLYILYRPYIIIPEYSRHLSSLLHLSLKPSGTMGHTLGIIGTVLMVLSYLLYFLRKRIEGFEFLGPLSLWLEIHIFFGILGPVLIFFHSGLSARGLVGLAFWAMVVVVLTGIFGRLLFGYCFWGITKIYEPLYVMDIFIEKDLGRAAGSSELIKRIKDLKPPGFPTSAGLLQTIKQWRYIQKETNQLINTINEKYDDSQYEEYSILRDWGDELVKRLREIRYVSVLDVMLSALNKWEIIHKVASYILFFLTFLHIVVTVYWGYRWVF